MKDLTKEQLAELEDDLKTLTAELRRAIAATEQGVKPVGLDQPIGRLSRMDALQQQSMTRATREGAELRLRQVESALLRLDGEGYGLCLECEESVGFERLKARPEAVLCIRCQSSREIRR
ncbi:MAG: TraR/DksA family transcriptional regulator [Myxococcales bacterium]|jgi:DnaK suppressor protein|nr:MAG: TraR/DksA family transcriptional regulator [Myxococcales bacterium]